MLAGEDLVGAAGIAGVVVGLPELDRALVGLEDLDEDLVLSARELRALRCQRTHSFRSLPSWAEERQAAKEKVSGTPIGRSRTVNAANSSGCSHDGPRSAPGGSVVAARGIGDGPIGSAEFERPPAVRGAARIAVAGVGKPPLHLGPGRPLAARETPLACGSRAATRRRMLPGLFLPPQSKPGLP